jgi:hypothetical protein
MSEHTDPLRPPSPEQPTPDPTDKREPPSRDLIRTLTRAAEDAELQACRRAIDEEQAQAALDQARRQHGSARNEAERRWALVQMALRAYARKQPMPTEAEMRAAIEYRREKTHTTVEIPDGAKAGDVLRNPTTGERIRLVKAPDGTLYGLPLEPHKATEDTTNGEGA